MTTLYRKYRPQKFKEIVGQNHVKITLEHEIKSGTTAHSYLFCGPRAVGKTTIARLLSKSVNCLNRKEDDHEPCGECEVCRDITAGKCIDMIEIDAASHTGVDNVRENIIAASRISPSRAEYKVFIIDEVHMLSLSAFNSLLKIIEEPPEYVMFILCTTEVHKVPSTIISRCQRFDFKRFSVSEITSKLQEMASKEGIKIDKKILEAIARQSEGHMRDAESLLGQIVSIGGKEISPEEADLVIPRSDLNEAINLLDKLARKDAAGAIGLINTLLDGGIDLKKFLSDAVELSRKMMLSKINPSLSERLGLELGESMEIKITEVNKKMSLARLVAIIDKFLSARNELKDSFILQLPVEIAIIELCTEPPAVDKPEMNRNTGANSKPAAPPTAANQVPAPEQAGKEGAETSKPSSAGQQQISTEAIRAKWNEVIARVKKHNHSLVFILRACHPKDVKGSIVTLVFKYKFHKDRIKEVNVKKMVESVFMEVYGLPLSIEAEIDEGLDMGANGKNGHAAQSQNTAQTVSGSSIANEGGEEEEKNNQVKDDSGDRNPMVDNLLKTFGGKVME